MDYENDREHNQDMSDILQKKEDLLNLFRDNEEKLEDKVNTMKSQEKEEEKRRVPHRPLRHRMVDKMQMERLDQLFEEALQKAKGSLESQPVETEPTPEPLVQAPVEEAPAPVAREEIPVPVKEVKEETPEMKAAEDTPVEPEVVLEKPEDEPSLFDTRSITAELSAIKALIAEDESKAPQADSAQETEAIFEEEPVAEEDLFEEEPVAEEDLFEEEPMAEEDLFEEEPMAEEPVREEEPVVQEPEPSPSKSDTASLWDEVINPTQPLPQASAMDAFFEMSKAEEEIPSILEIKAQEKMETAPSEESLAPVEAEEEPLWEEEPLEEEPVTKEAVSEEIPSEEPLAQWTEALPPDNFLEEETTEVPETDLFEEELIEVPETDLFEEELIEAPETDLFEEELIEVPETDVFEEELIEEPETNLFEEEMLEEPREESPVVQWKEALPEEDLFEEEVLEEPETDVFEEEIMEEPETDLFEEEILHEATPEEQRAEDEKARRIKAVESLGELRLPARGSSGETGPTTGTKVSNTPDDHAAIPKAKVYLSGAALLVALVGLGVYSFFCYRFFNPVDYLTLIIVAVFMILAFDMSTIATTLVAAVTMAAYFGGQVYYHFNDNGEIGTYNMFMVLLIPVLLLTASLFMQNMMKLASKEGK